MHWLSSLFILFMMKKYLSAILVVSGLAVSSMFTACMDEKFSSSPSDRLSFSADTVSFDTLFSTIGSATHLLKVYNRNEKSLMFSVRLADKANSGFRINVDGQNDVGVTSFDGLSIRGNDSLYIFIEVTSKMLNSGEVSFIKDSLIFESNGVTQDVKLIAYGMDALMLHGAVITKDTVFNDYRPIIVYDSLVVAEGATLTCDKGTSLYFHDKAGCLVRGRLVTKGELGNEVVFRGDRMDRLFPYLPYDRIPGQWGGVKFYGSSYDNELNYTDIHGGMYGLQCDSSDMSRQKISVLNSRISNTSGNNVELVNCKADFANSEISNAGGSCVDMTGGDVRFVHCTLANYFSYSIKSGVAFSLRNVRNEINYPVVEAAFYNSIIAGSGRDEISGGMSEDESVPYNYRFHYSLINSVAPESGDVTDCIWEKDDHFLTIDGDKFMYDFRLDSLSKAIGIGYPEYANQYPYDRNGLPRSTAAGGDGYPDAGCYERVSLAE